MSEAALDGLVASERALIAALDTGDAAQVEAATHAMHDALTVVATCRTWLKDADTGLRLVQALDLAHSAGGRVHYLADANRQKLDRLASLTGETRTASYGRRGRLA